MFSSLKSTLAKKFFSSRSIIEYGWVADGKDWVHVTAKRPHVGRKSDICRYLDSWRRRVSLLSFCVTRFVLKFVNLFRDAFSSDKILLQPEEELMNIKTSEVVVHGAIKKQ